MTTRTRTRRQRVDLRRGHERRRRFVSGGAIFGWLASLVELCQCTSMVICSSRSGLGDGKKKIEIQSGWSLEEGENEKNWIQQETFSFCALSFYVQ